LTVKKNDAEYRRASLFRQHTRVVADVDNFIERGLAGPTSDPELNLSYEFIIRESARLPRVRPPHRAGLSKERVLQ